MERLLAVQADSRQGMGYGDFKLLGAIGAWLGWQALPLVILLSSIVGVIAGIIVNLRARQGLGTRLHSARIWRLPA